MAWTQEQISGAQEWAKGRSAEEVSAAASQLGLSSADIDLVMGGRSSAAPAAPTPVTTPQQGRFSNEQYAQARNWANGKDWGTISAKASEMGISSDELGRVFGEFGGSGSQVKQVSGYGSGITGTNPDGSFKYNEGWGNKLLTDGSKPSDWTFDTAKGWSRASPPAQKNAMNFGMPSTGINLSQLQGTSSWDVTPNQTVFSQLQRIIEDDSPLMQQARARALQQANSRGLLNSSMAITAGDAAAYDAAMPIATKDASTYADSARFNADARNVFSRDNNQFVRDAYMADFNLSANEWAKAQDQARLYDRMSVEQKYALERDAAQNGFQSARDAILNGYQIARDDTANKFTLSRDATQNQFNAEQAALDRANRVQLQNISSANSGGQQADTSMQRLQLQLDADQRRFNQQVQTDATKNLNQSRIDYWNQVSSLSQRYEGDALTRQMDNLYASYAPVVQSFAAQAGLDPASATIGMRPASTVATVPAAGQEQAAIASAPTSGDGG